LKKEGKAMAFGFLGRRKRGPRRDRGGLEAPPGARVPHERDGTAQRQQQPVQPSDKLRKAARDVESGRQDTEARWRAAENFGENAQPAPDKPRPTVIIRRRHRL
jgi:hypothetical protein